MLRETPDESYKMLKTLLAASALLPLPSLAMPNQFKVTAEVSLEGTIVARQSGVASAQHPLNTCFGTKKPLPDAKPVHKGTVEQYCHGLTARFTPRKVGVDSVRADYEVSYHFPIDKAGTQPILSPLLPGVDGAESAARGERFEFGHTRLFLSHPYQIRMIVTPLAP